MNKPVTKRMASAGSEAFLELPCEEQLRQMKELAADLYERLDYHRIPVHFQMREQVGKLLLNE